MSRLGSLGRVPLNFFQSVSEHLDVSLERCLRNLGKTLMRHFFCLLGPGHFAAGHAKDTYLGYGGGEGARPSSEVAVDVVLLLPVR